MHEGISFNHLLRQLIFNSPLESLRIALVNANTDLPRQSIY